MAAILSVTLNPAVDFAASVENCQPGPKLRCDNLQTDPGGGGLNVSRAIAIIGGTSIALYAGGGANGALLGTLLTAEGLDHRCFEIDGMTRFSFAVQETTSGDQYRFVLPGPAWTADQQASFISFVAGHCPARGLVVLSGSQPPGASDDFAFQLNQAIHHSGGKLLVDTSGAALDRLLAGGQHGPDIMRMNQREAEKLAGQAFAGPAQAADFAQQMIRQQIADTIVMAHADKNLLIDATQRLMCTAPEVPIKSKVGAGDSFVGAFSHQLASGGGAASALKWGCAAASAAVMTDATQLCRRADIEKLLPACIVSDIV